MKGIVGLWVLYLGTVLCAFSQVDTSYIYNQNMAYGTLDLRVAKSPTRYYYLQEGITFSYRENAEGLRTNTYQPMTNWNTSAYGQGNLREVNGTSDNFIMNYRLLKPQNYDPSFSPGYPIIIMFHGGGETGNCWIDEKCYWATASYNPITNSPPAPTTPNHRLLNNDHNLLHGGSQHLSAVNLAGSKLPGDPTLAEGAFPGFVLFPQSLNGWGAHSTVEDAIRILRLIIKKYNVDENRVYIHGLSNGGAGVYQALKRAPWLFAAALPMSAVSDGAIINQGFVDEVAKLPLWIFQGGRDNNPTPAKTYNYLRGFRNAGANVRYSLYPNLGHGTWNTAFKEPDFFSWMRGKRKTNPHIAFGSPYICNTTQAGVRMAFSKGFFAYQWQRDGQVISGATTAEFTADTPGTYRGRFSRTPNPTESDWEPWSDPIVVSELNPEKPAVQVMGTAHLRGPGLISTNENNTVRLKSADSADLYVWHKDGTPLGFPGTDIDDTLRVATITSESSGANGVYTLVVNNYNCPSPPSDPVTLFFNNSSPRNIVLSSAAIDVKGTVTASSIFISWSDVSGLESGYEIWRREAGNPDFQFVAKTGEDAVSYHDADVHPGTTYEYKLRAVSNSGSSNYVPSDDVAVNYTFTTLGDTRFPPPPQDLTLVTNTLNTITLSWGAAADESSVKDYYIHYNSDSLRVGGDTTTYTLTGLPQNSVFAITVKAVDYGNHFSQPSNQIIATTFLSGLIYEHSTGAWESLDDSAMIATFENAEFTGKVPNFTLEPRTQDDYFNFEFTGYLNIETEGIYYFRLDSNDGSRLFLDDSLLVDNDGHSRRTADSEGIYLTAGPHPIRVQYFEDTGGHRLVVQYRGPSISDGLTFVNIPDLALRSGNYEPPAAPSPPAEVAANGTGMERVNISWQFTDDALTDYEVYRAANSSGPFAIVARAEGTAVIDSIGLTPGTAYYYKVKTVNNNGASDFSAVAPAVTLRDDVPPGVPQEVVLASKTLTSLAISWKPSTDNVGVVSYEIFSGGVLIGTSAVQAFAVEGLTPNTQYIFTVKAVDASGNHSAASAELAVITNTSAVFYSLATGNLSDLSTWRRNEDGSGDSPLNFSDNGQYFMVANRTVTSLGGPWTIGGNASRVIVPAGVTLTADHPFSAHVELQGDAVLNLNHATAPDLVKLSPASTVNFNGTAIINGGTYGNVILSGAAGKTFAGDTVSILGNLTVHEGIALRGSSQNSSYIRLSGMLTLQGTRPETPADNLVGMAFTGGVTQTITTGGDIYLYEVGTTADHMVTVANPSNTAISIYVGSLNGGGLRLANGSVFDIHNHRLILDDAAVVNPEQQTGAISTDGGDLMITSASGQNSYLYFHPGHNLVNRLTLDLTGAGNVTVRSLLRIADGIKVRNGTMAAEGNVSLLATPEKTAVIYEIENTGRITGEVTVQQHLIASGDVYRYLSTPVSGVTVSEWQQSFPITGSFSGASSGAGLDGSPSLFSYRESDGGWVPYPPAGGANAAPIEQGMGYAALLRNEADPVTLTVDGNPFQGNVSFPLSGGTAGSSGHGWNLVGNPYAAPVLWSNETGAWTRSGVNNVAAVRSDFNEGGQVRSQVTYYDVTLGGGTIPAGGAFWVRTFSAAPSLSISEEAKVNAEDAQTVSVPPAYLIVRLNQGELSDPAFIVFNSEGTDGFDAQYDGKKLRNYGMFNLSTSTAADTVALAVNHVTDEFCSKAINLNIGNVSPGSYSFAFENLQSMPGIGSIVLTDHFTETSTAITGEDYVFSVSADPGSFGAARFAITLTKELVDLSTPVAESSDVCGSGPAYVTVSNTQEDVLYQVISEGGSAISEMVAGNGESIQLEILPGELQLGANVVRVTAGFAGCDQQTLPGEVTVNLISELTVETDGDVSICEGADVTLTASGAPADGFYKWFDSNRVLIEGATSGTLTVSQVLREAVYYVAAAHPNGCESDLQPIHIYADTLDMPVILERADTLYTEVVGFYQWQEDGEDIPGATLNYYVPTESGNYSVIASNGGCFKESVSYMYDDGSSGGDGDGGDGDGNGDGGDGDGGGPVTGVENGHHPEFVLSIYPVPSNGHSINLLLRSPKTEPVLIEIIDTMGRLHFSRTIDAGVLMQGISVVPYAPLYNGIYFVRATQAEIRAREKIVVKD